VRWKLSHAVSKDDGNRDLHRRDGKLIGSRIGDWSEDAPDGSVSGCIALMLLGFGRGVVCIQPAGRVED
jgi:hypothetical protein